MNLGWRGNGLWSAFCVGGWIKNRPRFLGTQTKTTGTTAGKGRWVLGRFQGLRGEFFAGMKEKEVGRLRLDISVTLTPCVLNL